MFRLVRGRKRIRRRLLMFSVGAALVAFSVMPASTAYGGPGDFETWHVSIHIICNSVSTADPEEPAEASPNCKLQPTSPAANSVSTGVVDFIRFADGTTQGESHVSIHSRRNPLIADNNNSIGGWVEEETYTSWRIAPGRAGPQTFYVNGVAVRHGGSSCAQPEGNPVCADQPRNDFMTGISAVPGHYTTEDLLPFVPKTPGLDVKTLVIYHCYFSDQSKCTIQ